MTIVLPELVDGDLRLRPPAEADVDAIADACQARDIQRFTTVPSPYTADDARGFVAFAAASLDDGSGVHLVIVDRHLDTLFGAVGLAIDRADHQGELGYWLDPDARGRGHATRASRVLCRYALDELGLPRLTLHAAATNPRSHAVARRLGFTHEGTLRQAAIDGPTGDRQAPRCDVLVWGLLPGELR